MQLQLHTDMTDRDKDIAITQAEDYLEENKRHMNHDIHQILRDLLKYAKERLLQNIQTRCDTVNEIFNIGITAQASTALQKAFFPTVQTIIEQTEPRELVLLLCYIHDIPCREAHFAYTLEKNDAAHRNATHGILFTSLTLGLAYSVITDDYNYFLISLTALALMSPYAVEQPSPSKLGFIVYKAPESVRYCASVLNELSPVTIGYRLLNFFSQDCDEVEAEVDYKNNQTNHEHVATA